jgi:protein-S-isoprenylcysteine O-methyltransferase Ste14
MTAFESPLWTRWRVRLGYPVALIFLWAARPAPVFLAAGGAIAALGLVIRAAAAGYLRKHEGLAIAGPYARTRNPLYLGSAFLAAGFSLAGHSWLGGALAMGYFALFYAAVMRREERELLRAYGTAFEKYAREVPLFWPRLLAEARSRDGSGFSWAQYAKNREYQALIGYLAGLALLWLRMRLRG